MASLLAPVTGPPTLAAVGLQAADAQRLAWVLFGLCAIVYVVVMTFTVRGVRRAHAHTPPASRATGRVVVVSTLFTTVCFLFALSAAGLVGSHIAQLPTGGGIALSRTKQRAPASDVATRGHTVSEMKSAATARGLALVAR